MAASDLLAVSIWPWREMTGELVPEQLRLISFTLIKATFIRHLTSYSLRFVKTRSAVDYYIIQILVSGKIFFESADYLVTHSTFIKASMLYYSSNLGFLKDNIRKKTKD